MKKFVKKALQKFDKLDRNQIKKLLLNISTENETLEMVLDSMTDGVIVLDNSHRIMLSNRASKRLLPFASVDLNERIIWEVINDKEIAQFFFSALHSDERVTDIQFTLENGSTRIISCSIMPLVSKGKIQGNLAHTEDITEKKSREARLRRAESLASLTTLTAGVAHEIKNPLGSIGIHIQLIKKNLEKENEVNISEVDKYVDVIKEEVERLNRVVVDFLFAVHPINADFISRDINQVIIEMCNFMRFELEEAGIKQVVQLGELPKIEMDEKFMKQALLNIIKNAIAAMPEGGTLTIHTEYKDDKVNVMITDTGHGIPENILGKIFEPYFTTKDFGSGLGLTLVYKIIKEHQGDISVNSREREGTTFILSFPVPQKEKRLLVQKGEDDEI